MDLTKKPQQSTAVEKVSQNAIVRTLASKRFDQVSKALPARIEGTFDLPKVREMALATGEKGLCGFIEFELIKLAERINVSGNLTDAQIEFIASQLFKLYPNETIADFKLCFEGIAIGKYIKQDKLFKLDGIEIGYAMGEYLNDKYEVMEAQLMKEKDEMYKRPVQNTDWLQLWKEAIERTDAEGGVKRNSQSIQFLSHLQAMTPEQIREQGQKTPPELPPYKDPHSPEWYELKDRIRRAASEYYKERYSFSKMEIYTVKEHDVFAESADDAAKIYEMAVADGNNKI